MLTRYTGLLLAIGASLTSGLSVFGQAAAPNKMPEPRLEAMHKIDFSDGSPEMIRVMDKLVGSYHEGEYTLHIVRVQSPGMRFSLYVELSKLGFEVRPDRQQVWWLQETPTGIRIRVNNFPPRNEFLLGTNSADLAVGMWAAPDMFPQMVTDAYTALGDILVQWQNDELHMDSEYPHAIAFGGAMHSNTHHVVKEASFSWMEQGTDASGDVAWGGSPITMSRLESTPQAYTTPSGLRIIDLRVGIGEEVVEGVRVAIHFEGFTPSGLLLKSTRFPPSKMYVGTVPMPAIPGAQEGVMGMRAPFRILQEEPFSDSVRRIIIPPELGMPQGIPGVLKPNSTLVYNLMLRSVNPKAQGSINQEE